MTPLLVSAFLLWLLLRLFGPLETEGGFLRMLVIAVGITVTSSILREVHPLLTLLLPPLLWLILRRWCLLPCSRAAIVAAIYTGCQIGLDLMLVR